MKKLIVVHFSEIQLISPMHGIVYVKYFLDLMRIYVFLFIFIYHFSLWTHFSLALDLLHLVAFWHEPLLCRFFWTGVSNLVAWGESPLEAVLLFWGVTPWRNVWVCSPLLYLIWIFLLRNGHLKKFQSEVCLGLPFLDTYYCVLKWVSQQI